MKKSLGILTLAGVLALGGTVLAFADDMSYGLSCRNNGITGVESLMSEGMSFEEAKNEMLEYKYDRVDSAVEKGSVTSEEGEKIKLQMAENYEMCETPGQGKENRDGYGLNKGTGSGRGMRNGACIEN